MRLSVMPNSHDSNDCDSNGCEIENRCGNEPISYRGVA